MLALQNNSKSDEDNSSIGRENKPMVTTHANKTQSIKIIQNNNN